MKLRVYLTAIRPILLYGSETWSAPFGILSQLNVAERRFLRRMLGYRWPDTCSNEQLYAKVDAVYSKARHSPSTLPPPSSVVAANRLRLLGHIFRRPPDRLSQSAVHFRAAPSWRRLPGSGRRLLWPKTFKNDLRQLNYNKQFRRTPNNFVWHSDNWLSVVNSEDRPKWSALCDHARALW
uniref:Uncharacterized protein n=1 Tax=Plectus sambesii TaxID=2011161 RepID=A0A914W5X4_9BILA